MYMLGVCGEDNLEEDEHIPVFDIGLCLPSSLPNADHHRHSTSSLIRKETRLCEAQASDALNGVRRNLRICATLFDKKGRQAAGMGNRPNTRMIELQKKYKTRATREMHRYNAARMALMSLDPGGAWSTCLQELKHEHLHSPQQAHGEYEGHRSVSWIWIIGQALPSGTTVTDTTQTIMGPQYEGLYAS